MKSKEIFFDKNSIKSISEAITVFSEKLKNNEFGFETYGYQNSFMLLTENGENRALTFEDSPTPDLLHELFKLADHKVGNHYTSSYNVIADTIFFSIAISYPELKEDLHQLVKQIVDLYIKTNDNTEFWQDEYHCFGIDILYIFASIYPEFTYYISLYLIPYWDTEHAPYALDYLISIVATKGFYDKNVLKAIAYIQNEELLSKVSFHHEEDNLFNHLKNSAEAYAYFRQEYINCKTTYPIDLENSRGVHIVESMFMTIMGNVNFEDNLQSKFANSNLEEAVYSLVKDINMAFIDIDPDNYLFLDKNNFYDEYDDLEDEDEWEVNKDFFINGFANGTIIWNYILTGENPEVLDSIPPVNFMELATKKNLRIKKRLDYFGTDFDDIISTFINQFFDVDNNTPGYIIEINNKELSGKTITLRLIDVFYRLNDKKSFNQYTIDVITQDNEICTLKELEARFDPKTDKVLKEEITALISPFFDKDLNLNELEQIHLLYIQNPSLWKDILNDILKNMTNHIDKDMLAVLPKLQKPKQVMGSHLLVTAYLCSKEIDYEADENTKVLVDFFENNLWPLFFNKIKSYGFYGDKFKDDNDETKNSYLQEIKTYCLGGNNTPPPKDILIKLMKGGVDSLNEEEMIIFNKAKELSTPKSEDEIIKLLNSILSFNTQRSEEMGIPWAQIFSSADFNLLIPAVVYAAIGMPSNMFAKPISKLFNLILHIAPVKVLTIAFKSFVSNNRHQLFKLEELTNFKDILNRLKVPLYYIKAWEINLLQHYTTPLNEGSYNSNSYETLKEYYANLNTFNEDQPSIWLRQEKKDKEALKKALEFLDKENKLTFLKAVNEIQPLKEYNDYCKELMSKSLKEFSDHIISYDVPHWNRTEEQKLARSKKCIHFNSIISSYIYGETDFSEIESVIIPQLPEDISEVLNKDLWSLEEEARHRVLYMFAKFSEKPGTKMSNVYYYWQTWREAEDHNITEEFYNLLLKIGITKSYALHLFLYYFQRMKKHNPIEEISFAQHFFKIYKSLDLFEDLKNLPPNIIIFALREIANDLSISPAMLSFLNHKSMKVKMETATLLKNSWNDRLTKYGVEIIQQYTNASKENKNAIEVFINSIDIKSINTENINTMELLKSENSI